MALCAGALALGAGAAPAQGVARIAAPSGAVAASTPAPTAAMAADVAATARASQAGSAAQARAQPNPPASSPATAAAMPAPFVLKPYDPYVTTPASIIDRAAPLSPAEVLELRKTLDERSRAFQVNITGQAPPRPTSSQIRLEMSPGGTPPVVRVAARQGATLVFVDAAGRPWPVESADNFNDGGYQITQLAEHVFTIGMRRDHEIGGAVFKLKDIPRPVSITIQPAQQEADYSVDLVVPKFVGGLPPAGISSASAAPSHDVGNMLAFLYRTPPASARALRVDGVSSGDLQAWQINASSMVVRSAHEVVSPAHYRRQGSADGVSVYQLPLTSVVMISQAGALRNVQLAGWRIEAEQ